MRDEGRPMGEGRPLRLEEGRKEDEKVEKIRGIQELRN